MKTKLIPKPNVYISDDGEHIYVYGKRYAISDLATWKPNLYEPEAIWRPNLYEPGGLLMGFINGKYIVINNENNILITQELSKSEYVRYSKTLSPSRDIVDYIRDLFQSPKKIIRFIIGFVVTPFLTSIILKLIFVKISYSTPAFSISPAPSIYWNVVDLIVALWNFVFLFSVPALFILSKMKIAKPWSPWTINMCFCVEYYIALMCMNVTFNLGQSVF